MSENEREGGRGVQEERRRVRRGGVNIILILLLYFYSWTRRQDLVPHRCAIQDTRGKLTREEGEKRGRRGGEEGEKRGRRGGELICYSAQVELQWNYDPLHTSERVRRVKSGDAGTPLSSPFSPPLLRSPPSLSPSRSSLNACFIV